MANMNHKHSRVCSECKNWKCYSMVNPMRLEDEIGRCPKIDDDVFGDDDYAEHCEYFKSGKYNASSTRNKKQR